MQSSRRGRNQPLESWEGIKSGLIEVIDTDKDIEREFFNSSYTKLRQEIKNGEQFFQTLENNFGEHFHVVEFLINLTEDIGLHVDDGSTKVADSLREYLNGLKEYEIELNEKGLGTKCFIGREEELACIIQNLKTEKDRKGLLICGMGGMGKTSLAVEVCRHLYMEDKWNVFKIDLRGETTLRDLLRNTLTKFGERLPFSSTDNTAGGNIGESDLKYLQDLLIKRCNHEKSDTVLFLDNIDGILEKDRQRFLSFAQQLLQKSNTNSDEDDQFPSKMRIIFTAREKLISSKAVGLRRGLIQEVEIKGLNNAEAVELFTLTLGKEPDTDTVTKIVAFCGNCPLAILSLCNSIRGSELTPEQLLFQLQMNQKDAGEFDSFGIESCLEQSFRLLNKDLQRFLLELSVFRTAQFDIHAAVAIAGRSQSSKKAATALDLVHLKSRHFVEVTVEGLRRSKAYSLHPLVVQFLIKKTEGMTAEDDLIKKARSRFIEHFDGVVQSISLDLQNDPMETQRKLIQNKTHIQSFFSYLITSEGKLRQTCVDSPSVMGEFRRDELCSFILSEHERKDYYDQYIQYAKENGLILDEIYFKTAKARLFFEIDRSDECEKLLNETEDLINRENSLDEGTKSPLLGLFYWMKGRFQNARSQYKNALAMFERSLKFYQEEPELYNTDIANIYNSIGVLYYNQKEYDKSECYHRKALKMALEHMGVDAEGINIQVYYTNIATALFAQWQKQSKSSILEESNRTLLNQAEEYYTLAIYHDPKASESRAKKLTNRGKLYLKMERYDDAEQDFQESLQIRKDTLVPPNINLTHAYHNVGMFYFRKGVNPETKNKAECFVLAAKYYEEARFQIERGGLTLNDPAYELNKKYHKLALQTINDDRGLEKAKQFYLKFESGKFDKKIRRWKSIDETMTKSERLASTGKSFEKKSESNQSSDSEAEASSDSSDPDDSPVDITDEEGGDDFTEENIKSQITKSDDMAYGHEDMESSSSPQKDLGRNDEVEKMERDKLDSGIGSLASSSAGSSSNTDDVVSKRRRLVSMPSGSLEDNVFTHNDTA
ncbi:uncharacterized protein LOC134230071 [Saccostrea cucullata]|uniref:uncharacterized protein LOC134230071 n=1 Tax=Saccostrea cuccullata TaxID=36930 RepID=UPI002ED4A8C6